MISADANSSGWRDISQGFPLSPILFFSVLLYSSVDITSTHSGYRFSLGVELSRGVVATVGGRFPEAKLAVSVVSFCMRVTYLCAGGVCEGNGPGPGEFCNKAR